MADIASLCCPMKHVHLLLKRKGCDSSALSVVQLVIKRFWMLCSAPQTGWRREPCIRRQRQNGEILVSTCVYVTFPRRAAVEAHGLKRQHDPAQNVRIDVHDWEHRRIQQFASTVVTPDDLRNRACCFAEHLPRRYGNLNWQVVDVLRCRRCSTVVNF